MTRRVTIFPEDEAKSPEDIPNPWSQLKSPCPVSVLT